LQLGIMDFGPLILIRKESFQFKPPLRTYYYQLNSIFYEFDKRVCPVLGILINVWQGFNWVHSVSVPQIFPLVGGFPDPTKL